MSEWGGYGELTGYGVAVGWDTNEGLTISGFKSSSVGIAGDAWVAINFGGEDGFNIETPSVYVGVSDWGGVGVYGEWSGHQYSGHGYNEFNQIQADRAGVDIGTYLDPRGYGGNWGYNAPEFDRNHYQEISVDGQVVTVATDGTRLEHAGSSYTDNWANSDGTIAVETTNAQTGVTTETTFVQASNVEARAGLL